LKVMDKLAREKEEARNLEAARREQRERVNAVAKAREKREEQDRAR